MKVEGWTVKELSEKLKITVDAVYKRIETAEIEPLTRDAIFPPETYDRIKDIKMGRPRKTAAPEKPAAKSKKAKK